MARGVDLHTKRKRGHKSKAHITHMVGWSKLALLLINCSPNTLARRSFYAIDQQRNLGHPLKQNGPIKQPNKTAQKVMRQASLIYLVMPGYFPPIYASLTYCPVQMWDGTPVNPWYMHSPFSYLGCGAPPFYTF